MAKEDFDMAHIVTGNETEFELVDETPFFAPVPSDLLDGLMGQYHSMRARVERVAELMNGPELHGAVSYFISGNCGDEQLHRSLYVEKVFQLAGAIHSLDSSYWSRALSMTDVYECMPQKRKNEWNEQLRNPTGKKASHQHWRQEEARAAGYELPEWEVPPLPAFEEQTVRATITGLLHARSQFLAERVDGIFRALSGEHVTNAPEAFGKRMIVARIFNCYDTIDHAQAGFLHDLRCVIAKFMGREEPKHFGPTDDLLKRARHQRGQWITADGGALRIRVYKVGTAHLEVHPEMAYRLNQILAFMHPTAIPAEFRQKPKRKSKDFALMGRPLPFAVLAILSRARCASGPENARGGRPQLMNTRRFEYTEASEKAVLAEAERVLESIGGVREAHYFQFDYDPGDVIAEILSSGCIPDRSSHQYYPTPESIGVVAVQMADIGPEHTVGEFSAGQGALAALLPQDRTVCVEVSPLHCAVLRAKGYRTIEADFLQWHVGAPAVDRAVINPPFSEGRWRAHLEAAATLIAPKGRLVAILPASARQSVALHPWVADFELEWSRTFENEFAGTSASVVILAATRC